MPEYAELHTSAHVVQEAAHGHLFTSARLSSGVSIEGTAALSSFRLLCRHRGKEIFVAIIPSETPASGPPPRCITCVAVQNHVWGKGLKPRCTHHRTSLILRTVKKVGVNLGRQFWCCAANETSSCDAFLWEDRWISAAADGDWPPAKADSAPPVLLSFRRGMRGRFSVFAPEMSLPSDAHVVFQRADGVKLVFSDPRDKAHRVWNYGLAVPGITRSADPVWEFDQFSSNVLEAIANNHPAFESPLCEVLLNQEFFNGVGNYLRAEIMYTARTAPFERAKNVINAEFLLLCRDILVQAIVEKNRPWRRCYKNRGAKVEYDNNARAVWYFGVRGPLPGAQIVDTPCTTLVMDQVPTLLSTKSRLTMLASQFGTVQKVAFDKQRPVAWVRFTTIEAAQACLDALSKKTQMKIRFRRRYHKTRTTHDASSSAASSEDESSPQNTPKKATDTDAAVEPEGVDANSSGHSETVSQALPDGSGAVEPSGAVGFDRAIEIFAQHAYASQTPTKHRLASQINHDSALKIDGLASAPLASPVDGHARPLVFERAALRVVDIERASSGRAKCRHCSEAIVKGDWRCVFETQLRSRGFRKVNAYRHLQCSDGLVIDFDSLGACWQATEPSDQCTVKATIEAAQAASNTNPKSEGS